MDEQQASDADLLRWLREEQARPFAGWDFSHLRGRMLDDPLPWDYQQIVRAALPRADNLLDMDTGGGEVLASLRPLPARCVATEAYPPNVPAARARLAPLGVSVVKANAGAILPFLPGRFDLIINRHGSYVVSEVARLLRPGGVFIMQQVGSRNLDDLRHALHAPPRPPEEPPWTLVGECARFAAAGLRVLRAEEAFPWSRFTDVGALVYYLKAVPWEAPDFTIERSFATLKALHRQIAAEGPLAVRSHRVLLVAEKAMD